MIHSPAVARRIALALLAAALLCAAAPPGAAGAGDCAHGFLACAVLAERPLATPAFRADLRRVPARGLRVAYYRRGSGPPLLMAIGTGSTLAEWDPALLRALAARRNLILFDYRGVGETRGPLGRLTFAGLADDAAALVRALDLDCVDALGWSMGGFVVQQLAIRHPALVRGLVLAGTNAGGRAATLGPPWAQRLDSAPDASDAEALELLFPRDRAGQAAGRAFLRRLAAAADSGEVPDDFDVPARTVDAQVAAEDPWLRSDVNFTALARLRAPVLAAGGTLDPVVPPANLRRIAAQVPQGRLALYPHTAHAFLFQDAPGFATATLDFLDAARPACR